MLELCGFLTVFSIIVLVNVSWKLWDSGFYRGGGVELDDDEVFSVTRQLLERSS